MQRDKEHNEHKRNKGQQVIPLLLIPLLLIPLLLLLLLLLRRRKGSHLVCHRYNRYNTWED